MSTQNVAYTITPHCFRCNYFPRADNESLKRCGRCHGRSYCSSKCQRSDWPEHKQECRILADGGEVPLRQSAPKFVRIPHAASEPAQSVDPDVIYYLRTSRPHIQDMSISGPYYPQEKAFEQVMNRVATEGSDRGKEMFADFAASGMFDNSDTFTIPLREGNEIKFELLKEKNAEVARIWPSPVYMVHSSQAASDMGDPAVDQYARVVSSQVHGTFTALAPANAEARRVLKDLKSRAGTGAQMVEMNQGDLVQGGVVPRSNREGMTVVQVRHEVGTIVPPGQ